MSIFARLQPVFIILAALAGVAAGRASPFLARHSGNFIEFFLMAMLFSVFLSVNIREITKSFTGLRFSLAALAMNFVWTPLFALLLAKAFMAGQTDLQTGFIMLMVTPCTDWYLIFTGLASGNVALASSILPLNLVLQVLLLPVYLFLFMGKTVSFDGMIMGKSIVFVLALPLVSANVLKFVSGKSGMNRVLEKVLAKSDDIQFLLLCLAIVSMFASQGTLLFEHLNIFFSVFPPLILFFAVNFALAFFAGKKLGLSFFDTIPLIFTASARNSPVSLAIATVAFPSRPVISLVLVIGPLIELPVLAAESALLKKLWRKKAAPGGEP